MNTVGEFVQEAMDLSDRGLFEFAFLPTCRALEQTAEKEFKGDNLFSPDFQEFIRNHWDFIFFAAIPRPVALPPDLPFRLRRAVPSFNVPDVLKELVTFAVRQTLATTRIPIEIGFNRMGGLEVKDDRLLFPTSLLFGLLASVVFHPLNKNEKIPDRYWLNVRDFKMFVSELWGREDLAERIMNQFA